MEEKIEESELITKKATSLADKIRRFVELSWLITEKERKNLSSTSTTKGPYPGTGSSTGVTISTNQEVSLGTSTGTVTIIGTGAGIASQVTLNGMEYLVSNIGTMTNIPNTESSNYTWPRTYSDSYSPGKGWDQDPEQYHEQEVIKTEFINLRRELSELLNIKFEDEEDDK